MLKITPDSINALQGRGEAHSKLGKLDKAIIDFTRIININPSSYEALFERGSIYLSVKEIDNALADFASVLKLFPEHHEALYNTACAYSRKNQVEKAIYFLEQAIHYKTDYKTTAKNDADFENIMNFPDFKKLLE